MPDALRLVPSDPTHTHGKRCAQSADSHCRRSVGRFRHAAAHAVVGHFDDRIAVLPKHLAGLAIVGDLPGFGRDFDECLVAVIVVDGLAQFF